MLANKPHVCQLFLFAGVRRELYLCDDGKDPTKRVWLETNYGEGSNNASKGNVHYVSGRCVLRVPWHGVVVTNLLCGAHSLTARHGLCPTSIMLPAT